MLRYKFTINGEELERVSIGVKLIEKLEEAMDTATLKLKVTNKPNEFQMYDLLQVTVKDEDDEELTFDFLINGDRVEEGSKYGEYIHNLDFMEYTYKYNMYMVHSLTRTKNIKNDNPAPFVVGDVNYYDNSKSRMRIGARLDPIDVKTSYYANEDIVFPQVAQGYQINTGFDVTLYDRVDAYVQIVGQPSTRQIISSGDATFNLSAGDYQIEYGFVGTVNLSNVDQYFGTIVIGDNMVYRFNVRVIERESVSVLDLLNLVRDNVSIGGGIESKLYFDDTRLFDIDPNIQDYLASVEAPQIFVQKATLRQVLNSIFLYVNAISRVRWNDENIDELTVDWFNQINGTFSMKNIANYTTQQTAQQLASKGISYSERALPDNRERANLKLASQNQYFTVRSNNIQIVNGKFGIDLNGKAMYEPKDLYVNFKDVTPRAWDDNDNFKDGTAISELDLSLITRFINQEAWNIKDFTTNFPSMTLLHVWEDGIGLRENKVGNIAWTQGSTYINFSEVYGEVFQESLILNVIAEGFYEYFTRNMPEPIFDNDGYMYTQYGFILEQYDGFVTEIESLDYEYIKFGLDYITQQDTTLEAERSDNSIMPYYAEAKMNQNDKVTNVELASRRLYGVVQRSGTPKKTFVKYHNLIRGMLPTAVIDSDKNVITQRGIELQNNYLKTTYTTTKFHNRSSLFAGLQQDYRAFEIPTTSQVYKRIEAYTDYILISKPDNSIVSQDTITKIYSNKTLELMFGILTNDSTLKNANTKVTKAYVRTDGFLNKYPNDGTYDYAISTEVNSFGAKNELTFEFGFISNQIAGNGVYTNSENLRYNNAIKYTDDLGRFNELWFQLNTVYDNPSTRNNWSEIERLDNFPLERSNANAFGQDSTITHQSGAIDFDDPFNDNLMMTKDGSQSIIIDYKNRLFVLDKSHYVIGQAFGSDNFLVYNKFNKDLYVYIYDTQTTYYEFDDLRIKDGFSIQTLLINNTNCWWDSVNNTFRFIGSLAYNIDNNANWAIGDSAGELYWACNYNHNGFDIFMSHFRPDLKEIGNRYFPTYVYTNIDVDINVQRYTFESTQLVNNIGSFSQVGTMHYSGSIELGHDVYVEELLIQPYTFESSKSISTMGSFEQSSEFRYGVDIVLGHDAYVEEVEVGNYTFESTKNISNISSFGKVSIIEYSLDIALGHDYYIESLELSSYKPTSNKGLSDIESFSKIGTIDFNLGIELGKDVSESVSINYSFNGLQGISTVTSFAKIGDILYDIVVDTPEQEVGWVSGGTSPTVGQTCNSESDIGNVRCDSTCVWDETFVYFSTEDETTPLPPRCSGGAEKTICVLNGSYWICTDYTGDIEYSNCETCEVV